MNPPDQENATSVVNSSPQDVPSSGTLRFVEDAFFFVVRLILLIVLVLVWFVLGGIYSAWVIFRASIAYSFSLIAGIVHGGRDYAGSVASLRPAVGVWPQGFEQIFRALDPRKRQTTGPAVPFEWSKLIFESVCTFLFIAVIASTEIATSAIWGTFVVRPRLERDGALSETKSRLETAETALAKAQTELGSRTLWRAARLSTRAKDNVTFYRLDEGKWVPLESSPDHHWTMIDRNAPIIIKFRPTSSSPEKQFNLKTSLFDKKPSDAERESAPNNYFWQNANGEIELSCD